MLGSAPSSCQRAIPDRNVGRCTHNVRVSASATRRSTAGRTARASVEVWSLTVVAHTVAGGALPSLPWLVGVAGLVTVSTAWVLRRSVRPAVMLPVLVLCQLGLHALFATLSPAGAAVGHAPGHAQHAAAPSSWWMEELSPRMAAAHVLCALLTAVVWWVRRWVVDVVLSLGRPLAVAMRPATIAGVARASLGTALVWLVGSPGRAPPCAAMPA